MPGGPIVTARTLGAIALGSVFKRGEQLLGLNQVRCPKAFGEPTVHGREQIAGFGAPALLARSRAKLLAARSSHSRAS